MSSWRIAYEHGIGEQIFRACTGYDVTAEIRDSGYKLVDALSAIDMYLTTLFSAGIGDGALWIFV